MTREEGVQIVRERDHIKTKDFCRWLDYVGWTEEDFDATADIFRDPSVWTKDEEGKWIKDCLWFGGKR